MDRVSLCGLDGPQIVHRLANYVHHATECSFANWHRYPTTGIDRFHAANHTIGWQHRNCTHAALPKMLLDLAYDIDRGRYVESVRNNSKCSINGRQVPTLKFDVHYWTDDLHYATGHMAVRTSSVSVRRSHTLGT